VEMTLPDWAGRHLLADALRAVGLPVIWGAAWRRPADRWMTYEERLFAIELEARVVAEARRLLPPGVSGAAIGEEWRAMSWGCTVAAVAVLDAQARQRLGKIAADEAVIPKGSGEPLVIRRRDPASTSTTSTPPTILFRRCGEVQRAS
jgi:hypothetical protein